MLVFKKNNNNILVFKRSNSNMLVFEKNNSNSKVIRFSISSNIGELFHYQIQRNYL